VLASVLLVLEVSGPTLGSGGDAPNAGPAALALASHVIGTRGGDNSKHRLNNRVSAKAVTLVVRPFVDSSGLTLPW
jgi:hypothetical protein